MDNKVMKPEDRTDLIIEGETCQWEINVTGDIKGTYMGTFRFRCFLTPSQRLAAGRHYRELLGENPTLALKHEDNLAFSLSQLKQRIMSAPPFWSSTVQLSGVAGDIPDEEVIDLVLEAAIDAEIKYKKQLAKRKEDALDKAKKAAEKMLQMRDNTDEDEDDEGQDQADNDKS